MHDPCKHDGEWYTSVNPATYLSNSTEPQYQIDIYCRKCGIVLEIEEAIVLINNRMFD